MGIGKEEKGEVRGKGSDCFIGLEILKKANLYLLEPELQPSRHNQAKVISTRCSLGRANLHSEAERHSVISPRRLSYC